MSNEALLVVDVQVAMVEGEYQSYQAPQVVKKIQTLIDAAKLANVPVIYVQHDEALEFDGPIHPSIAPKGDEPVIHKLKPNAFFETNLQETLDELGVKKLTIVGFQTDYCINATSEAAHTLGYQVRVVEDSHSTTDSNEEDAATIISKHNAKFAKFAQLVTADSLKFGL